MTKLLATNDPYIEQLLDDPAWVVLETGRVFLYRTKNGRKTNVLREVSYRIKNGGYKYIKYKNKQLNISRIVYAKYTGSLSQNLVINHINGNKADNRVENLELVSQGENNKHKYRVLGHKSVVTRNKWEYQVESIRKDRILGMKYSQITEKYGICKSLISDIVNNKIWKSS